MQFIQPWLHPLILLLVTTLALSIQAQASAAFYLVHTLGMVALLALLEYVLPFEQRSRNRLAEVPGYLGMAVFSFTGGLLAGPVNAWLDGLLSGNLITLADYPLLLQVPVGIIAAEFGFYAYHRMAHKIPALWAFHAVHHLPRRMNLGGYFYMHPVDAFCFGVFRTLPLLILGVSPQAIFVIAIVSMTQKLTVHSNLSGNQGRLRYVLGTSEMHRMHHTEDFAEMGNYGIVLPLWDQVFGTFRLRPDGGPVRYGIPKEDEWPQGASAVCCILCAVWIIVLYRSWKPLTAALLREDPDATAERMAADGEAWFGAGRPKLGPVLMREALPYLRPGLHPDDIGHSALMEEALAIVAACEEAKALSPNLTCARGAARLRCWMRKG